MSPQAFRKRFIAKVYVTAQTGTSLLATSFSSLIYEDAPKIVTGKYVEPLRQSVRNAYPEVGE